MDLKEYIFKNVDKIGLSENISYSSLLKLEELILEWDKQKTGVDEKDIKKLLDISLKMKELLEKCRQQKLPVPLAQKIDDLLKEINYL